MALTENEVAIVDVQCVGMLDVNCYFVYIKASKNLYIIDCGSDAQLIIRKAKAFDAENTYLLQTHCHVDHISALGTVKEKLNAKKLYIHPDEVGLYLSPDNHLMPYLPAAKNLPEPDVGYAPEEVEVIHTPGHTLGGVCLYFKQIPALFTGDTLFQQSVGRTDLPGGDHPTLLKSIKEKLMTLPENLVAFPGHGPSTTIGAEKKHNPYL